MEHLVFSASHSCCPLSIDLSRQLNLAITSVLVAFVQFTCLLRHLGGIYFDSWAVLIYYYSGIKWLLRQQCLWGDSLFDSSWEKNEVFLLLTFEQMFNCCRVQKSYHRHLNMTWGFIRSFWCCRALWVFGGDHSPEGILWPTQANVSLTEFT